MCERNDIDIRKFKHMRYKSVNPVILVIQEMLLVQLMGELRLKISHVLPLMDVQTIWQSTGIQTHRWMTEHVYTHR
eukprot:UN02400